MENLDLEYIIMCKESKEIQKYAKEILEQGPDGEFIYAYWGISRRCPKCNSWVSTTYCGWCGKKPKETEQWYISQTNGGVFKFKESKDIWLPRQEHLQKMLPKQPLSEILESFHWFVVELSRNSNKYMEFISDGDSEKINNMSHEKIWLSFVMNRLYGKKWNGKRWVS